MSNEPRRLLLTHFDLDGVASDIIMSSLYIFEKIYKSGYPKMRTFIDNGRISGYDSIVVTDISLTPEQYYAISTEYGKKFVYIDHHKPSVDMINNMENPESLCFVDTKFAAAGIAYQVFQKRINPRMIKFIAAVDAYDCWRHQTHPDMFEVGYDLNTLFWKYGYDKFRERFMENPITKWNNEESKWISTNAKERDEALTKSDKNEFGENSLLVLDAPREYVNEYGLNFPEYSIFFLLYLNFNGGFSLSVRTTRKDVNIGEALSETKNKHSYYITTAGGHPEAGGVDFVPEISLDMIIDIVETINNKLEGNEELCSPDDVPF